MKKRIILAIAIIATIAVVDNVTTNKNAVATNTCIAATYDRNSDGFIYKGTITLTRVISDHRDTFLLFNKRGVDYVAISKFGPYYRLSRRMNIGGIDYKL